MYSALSSSVGDSGRVLSGTDGVLSTQ